MTYKTPIQNETISGVKTFSDGAAIKGKTDGAAVATGYVGEKINWVGSSVISVTGANTNFGNGSTTGVITLGPGTYISTCYGEFGPSDNTVYAPTALHVISGTASITNMSPVRGAVVSDDISIIIQNFTRIAYIVVTATALITVRNTALSGGTGTAGLLEGSAVRIA